MEELVKSDLNVHLDGRVDAVAVTTILMSAQLNGVKAISIMEQDSLDLYKEDGILQSMIKSGEIEKIYSGKIISGVELTCVVDKTESKKLGFNFNGYFVHITLLDFDIPYIESQQWFDPNFKKFCIQDDISIFCKLLKKYKLDVPPPDYFVYDRPLPLQLYDYVKENPERVKQYEKILGKMEEKTEFVKKVFEDPVSQLYFKPSYIPYLSEVIEMVRQSHGRLYISHPAHMNKKFNTIGYLDALNNINTKFGLPFDGIEVYYGYNTDLQTKMLKDYAITHHLEMSGNSGYRYTFSKGNPKGMLYWQYFNETKSYIPKPGFMIRSFMEKQNGDIMLDSKLINSFDDIRDTERFRF